MLPRRFTSSLPLFFSTQSNFHQVSHFYKPPQFQLADRHIPTEKNLRIKCISFDGGGTTSKYCYEPAQSFTRSYAEKKIALPVPEARKPTGYPKREHNNILIQNPRVQSQWLEIYGAPPTSQDIEDIYQSYMKNQLMLLENTVVVPGMPETIQTLRKNGIAVALNTAYSQEETEVFLRSLKKQGVEFDYVITNSDVKHGRPYPFMLHRTAEYFGLKHPSEMLVIGDTKADMQAALNGRYPRVGAAGYSSLLNIDSNEEGLNMHPAELFARQQLASDILSAAGANYILQDDVSKIVDFVEDYNDRLKTGNFSQQTAQNRTVQNHQQTSPSFRI